MNVVVKAEEEMLLLRGSDSRRVGHVLIYFVDLFSKVKLHNHTACVMGAVLASD